MLFHWFLWSDKCLDGKKIGWSWWEIWLTMHYPSSLGLRSSPESGFSWFCCNYNKISSRVMVNLSGLSKTLGHWVVWYFSYIYLLLSMLLHEIRNMMNLKIQLMRREECPLNLTSSFLNLDLNLRNIMCSKKLYWYKVSFLV